MPKRLWARDSSAIDGAIAIKDIYPKLLFHMKEARKHPLSLSTAGQRGVGWGKGAGESYALDTDRFLAADGIENIIKVLEELEDEKLRIWNSSNWTPVPAAA